MENSKWKDEIQVKLVLAQIFNAGENLCVFVSTYLILAKCSGFFF